MIYFTPKKFKPDNKPFFELNTHFKNLPVNIHLWQCVWSDPCTKFICDQIFLNFLLLKTWYQGYRYCGICKQHLIILSLGLNLFRWRGVDIFFHEKLQTSSYLQVQVLHLFSNFTLVAWHSVSQRFRVSPFEQARLSAAATAEFSIIFL